MPIYTGFFKHDKSRLAPSGFPPLDVIAFLLYASFGAWGHESRMSLWDETLSFGHRWTLEGRLQAGGLVASTSYLALLQYTAFKSSLSVYDSRVEFDII
jgi:hypothetical protein